MKVVIISDTHMSRDRKKWPERLMKELTHADHIVHAGDFSTMDIYDELLTFAPVTGVHGNVDDDDVMNQLPAKQIITLDGIKIGITHGHGKGKTTERRAVDAFAGDSADIIVFGPSHIPVLRYFKKQMLINPGSPTDKRTNPYYSFVLLEIGSEIRVEHVFFE